MSRPRRRVEVQTRPANHQGAYRCSPDKSNANAWQGHLDRAPLSKYPHGRTHSSRWAVHATSVGPRSRSYARHADSTSHNRHISKCVEPSRGSRGYLRLSIDFIKVFVMKITVEHMPRYEQIIAEQTCIKYD